MSTKESAKQWNLNELVFMFLESQLLLFFHCSSSNRLLCPFYYRAVYYKADIYILDDPLSAVDVRVGRKLFDAWVMILSSKRTATTCNTILCFFFVFLAGDFDRQNVLPNFLCEDWLRCQSGMFRPNVFISHRNAVQSCGTHMWSAWSRCLSLVYVVAMVSDYNSNIWSTWYRML